MARDPLSIWTEQDTLLRGDQHIAFWLAGANVRLEELTPVIDALRARAEAAEALVVKADG